MNFEKDLQRILEREGLEAIERHASVSRTHKCNCNECFCCYCLDYIKAYNKTQEKVVTHPITGSKYTL